jgi:hypothetical protein
MSDDWPKFENEARAWFSARAPISDEIDALRRENDRLRAERDALITSLARQTARLAEEVTKTDTLRELVREAMDLPIITASWKRSAEKALGKD